MNFFKKFLASLALSVLAVSCTTKEDVGSVANENSASPAFSGTSGINRPVAQCGSSSVADLIDNSGNVYGVVELANDRDDVYVMISTTGDWIISDLNIYFGAAGNIPVATAGNLQQEAFTYSVSSTGNLNQYTFHFHNDYTSGCNALVVAATGKEMDFSGSTYNDTQLWMDGSTLADGFVTNYCPQNCPPMAGSSVGSSL